MLRGHVFDNMDPLQRGRVKVQIWGVHKEENDNIPWAEVMGPTAFGLHKGVGVSSVLQLGTTVWVDFEQGDINCPVVVGVFVGHDTCDMSGLTIDNSDFSYDTKGANYTQVQQIVTPKGHKFTFNDTDCPFVSLVSSTGHTIMLHDCEKYMRFKTAGGHDMKMDDANQHVTIKTTGGNSISLNDKEETITLQTPCGAALVLNCKDKTVSLTNGTGNGIVIGEQGVTVNGTLNVTGCVNAPCFSERGVSTAPIVIPPWPDDTEPSTDEDTSSEDGDAETNGENKNEVPEDADKCERAELMAKWANTPGNVKLRNGKKGSCGWGVAQILRNGGGFSNFPTSGNDAPTYHDTDKLEKIGYRRLDKPPTTPKKGDIVVTYWREDIFKSICKGKKSGYADGCKCSSIRWGHVAMYVGDDLYQGKPWVADFHHRTSNPYGCSYLREAKQYWFRLC